MNLQDKYNQLVAQKDLLISNKKKIKRKLKTLNQTLQDHKDTRTILNEAIRLTHQKFKDQIEIIITKSIRTIFNRDFTFELQYEEKRNEIESKIIVKENDEELDPKDEMGGSIVDIISFAFRICLWHMSSPRSRNTFILDEPFRFCGKLSSLAGMVLKELSELLKFQVILITHDDELVKYGDRVFKVFMRNSKSYVLRR